MSLPNLIRNTPALLLLLLTMISGHNLVMAQDINENNFVRYTKEHGLSQNTVTGIAQDSMGFIWISTVSGLNRFNGSKFIQYHSTDDSLSLPQEYLTGMVWLDGNRLGCYGQGLHIVNTRTGQTSNLFVPYPDKRYQYKFNAVIAVKGSPAGDIFLSTRSGFYHFDKNNQLVFRFDYYSAEQVPVENFGFGGDILWLDQHRLAVFSSRGIYCYHTGERLFKKMEPDDCAFMIPFLDFPKNYQFFQPRPGAFLVVNGDADSLVYFNVPEKRRTASYIPATIVKKEFDYRSQLLLYSDTVFYLTGNLSGFFKLRVDPETGIIKFFPEKYFAGFRCRQLMKDRNANLWIGTTRGLFRQDERHSFVQLMPVPPAIETAYPKVLLDDIAVAGNRVFTATLGDVGMLEFGREQLDFIRRIDFGKSVKDAGNIGTIIPVNNNSLLVGTNGPLYRYSIQERKITAIPLEKFEPGDWVAFLYRDHTNTIWVTAQHVYKYDPVTNKATLVPHNPLLSDRIQRPNLITEDSYGNIWISGHGLLRYNTHTHAFDQLIDSFPYIKIPDRQVNALTADNQGHLWFNSNNNGLICYTIETGAFRRFTSEDGLPDNNIASLIVLGNKLWIASYSGIACLDMKTNRITNFSKDDGFPDEPVSKGSNFFYDSNTNRLYIAFASTIAAFDPAIIYQKSLPPFVFIEKLSNCNKPVAFPGKTFTTSWRNNDILITIGSINFTSGSSQGYAYRLLDNDSTRWQQLGEQNTFSLSNLSPGYHRIQVKVFSVHNRWPEQVKEIGITITPPFWNEAWFTALAVMLLFLLVYLLLKWRTGIIRKKEQAKTRIQQLKADEYKNQFELEQISNYFSSSLAGKKNVDDVLWDVARNLIGRMNFTDCMIYTWNADKSKMIQKASYGPKGDPRAISEKHFDVAPGEGIVGYVMQTKEPLLVTDTRKDSRYRVDDISRLSELCVPIIHNNELIGVIDSEHHNLNHFNERDMKILTTIATLVGNKIAQIESERSLEIKQKELATLNQQLAEAQLSALQTQMNPHFIFNSLNSIKGMILADEQQKASRYLSKFAQMIRITLSQSKEIFTTLYENVEHLENYLTMEKLRFESSFTFTISVDEAIDTEETLIPTLMIQPLAENAIWHGLMPKKGEKKLSIRFLKTGNTISCIIKDNGIGIRQSEQLKIATRSTHQSVGLNNLRNRIKIMNEKYHTNCTLEITDLQDFDKNKTGTCAALRFNIITNKPHL